MASHDDILLEDDKNPLKRPRSNDSTETTRSLKRPRTDPETDPVYEAARVHLREAAPSQLIYKELVPSYFMELSFRDI